MGLKIDQRPFKDAVGEALDAFGGLQSIDRVLDLYDQAVIDYPHYLNTGAVRHELRKLLAANNPGRARKLLNAIPDRTASRPVVAVVLVVLGLIVLAVLALVVGLAIFLWGHFFG